MGWLGSRYAFIDESERFELRHEHEHERERTPRWRAVIVPGLHVRTDQSIAFTNSDFTGMGNEEMKIMEMDANRK
jgi:hypothetical protein